MTASFVPQPIWTRPQAPEVMGEHVESPTGSQYGCPYCLAEGSDTPLSRVYMWAGTSFCAKHYRKEVLKQEPPSVPQ